MNPLNCTVSDNTRPGVLCTRSLRTPAVDPTRSCTAGTHLLRRAGQEKQFAPRRGSLQRRPSPLVPLVIGLVLLLSTQGVAQLSTASINGLVRDSSGAIIPNATIKLRNVDTSVENTTVTNRVGAYAILSITPGRYTLSATAPGFGLQQVSVFGGHRASDFAATRGSKRDSRHLDWNAADGRSSAERSQFHSASLAFSWSIVGQCLTKFQWICCRIR
jgi:hypothetical protein